MTRRPFLSTTRVLFCSWLLAMAGCGRAAAPTAPLSGAAPSKGSTKAASGGNSIAPVADYDPNRVIWQARDPSVEGQVETENGLERVGTAFGYSVCRVAPGQDAGVVAQGMLLDSRVDWAEPNYRSEAPEARGHSWAFDEGWTNQGGYEDQSAAVRLGLTLAHAVSTGRGQIVAVLDTGVNPDHPLLAGHVLPGYDFVDDDADAREAADGIDNDGDGLIDEAIGHGTHVAGIVALGAPGARLLPVRVLDDDGRGDAYGVARGIEYALSRGARVLNLSLGMLAEDRLVEAAVNDALARGAVVVASAGNWGTEEPEEYPAHFDLTTAVAATDAQDLPASFTSFGDFVSLCAPGDGIRSAYWNGHTAIWSGTSMSAPFVSAGAALLLAVHPSWGRTEVISRLMQTATPFDSSVPEASRHFGAGRLNLGAALAPDRVPGSSGRVSLVD